MSNGVGVAEHPDMIETIEKELCQVAKWHEQKEMIHTYLK